MDWSAETDFIKYLSGGNHELFHSNLLAFLAKQCPDFFRAVFEPELGADFPSFNAKNVNREKNNFDVSIEIDGRYRLVLENKMKSIPTVDQLDRYEEDVIKNQKDLSDCKLILLTLVPLEKCPDKWQQINYRQLSFRMRKHLHMLENIEPSYLIDFVEDYIEFIELVYNNVVTTDLYDEKKDIIDFFKIGSDSAADQWIELLKKKIAFSALANSIEQQIDASDYIFVGSHIVRGTTPLAELWFRVGGDGLLVEFDKKPQNSFWIQISNGQIHRGFLIMNKSIKGRNDDSKPKGRTAREDFLKEIYNQCMCLDDFKLIRQSYADSNILPKTADNLTGDSFRGYIYDKHIMVYIIEEIKDTNVETVGDLITKVANEAKTILANCKPTE